jgi:hypothetical protein
MSTEVAKHCRIIKIKFCWHPAAPLVGRVECLDTA